MQLCNVSVNLAGSLLNRVPKRGVTVAEIVVLRAVHGGSDAVTNIQPVGMDKRPHAEELERLSRKYGKIVAKLFPGAHPQLPSNLADIGVTYDGGEKKRKRPAPAAAAVATDTEAGDAND